MYFPIIDALKENLIKIPSIVTKWLEDNVNPVGSAVVVDKSLSISGAAADAKVTGDEISNLKSDLSLLVEEQELVLHKADFETEYDTTYVNNGYIGSSGDFTANNGYRTYYLQATNNMSVYLTKASSYGDSLSLAVYNSSGLSTANFIARYRSGDDNLPTQENKLAVTKDQWLAVSIYSSQDYDFNFGTGETTFIPIPTDVFAQNIAEKITSEDNSYIGKATKTATSLTVSIGKLKYEINKYSNSTIRAYMWRTNACRVKDNDDTYQTVWEDSDSDGVVKIRGESDFIGGYHGDETETLFHLFVDGVEYAEDSTFTDLNFNEIILYFESDVYHCNTSSTPDVVAFKRNKIIKFNDEGYTVENYWTAQENLTCEISYIGMLSVENALVNAYHTNDDFKYHVLDNGVERSANITDVCFNTPYGDIGVKISDAIPNENYGCVVTAYTGRLKVYASNFSSSAHGALTSGDVLKGKAVTYFRG